MFFKFKEKVKVGCIAASFCQMIAPGVVMMLPPCIAMDSSDEYQNKIPGVGYSCWPKFVTNCLNMEITLSPEFFKSQLSQANMIKKSELDECCLNIENIKTARKTYWENDHKDHSKPDKKFNQETERILKSTECFKTKIKLERELEPFIFDHKNKFTNACVKVKLDTEKCILTRDHLFRIEKSLPQGYTMFQESGIVEFLKNNSLQYIDIKCVIDRHLLEVGKLYDDILYGNQQSLRESFDAAFGDDSCQAQALMLLSILKTYRNIFFSDLPKPVQETLVMMNMLTPKNNRDSFGMVISEDHSNVQSRTKDSILFKKILSETTIQTVKSIAVKYDLQDFVNLKYFIGPEKEQDRFKVPTTLLEAKVVFEYLKETGTAFGVKYNAFKVIDQQGQERIKGYGQAVFIWKWDLTEGAWVIHEMDTDFHEKIVFCRMASVFDDRSREQYLSHDQRTDYTTLKNGSDSFHNLKRAFSTIDIEKMILVKCAWTDQEKFYRDSDVMRPLTFDKLAVDFQNTIFEEYIYGAQSDVFKKVCQYSYFEDYKGTKGYSLKEFPMSIYHFYVSTIDQQMNSFIPDFIEISKNWSLDHSGETK